jgi:hypothetical protein
MQPPWHKILDFWNHPSPRIQCKQSSKDVGKEAIRKDIFEVTCQRVEDFLMSGINVKNILLKSIYRLVHLKIARWPWNPMPNFEGQATRGRKCSNRWKAFFSWSCTSPHVWRWSSATVVCLAHMRTPLAVGLIEPTISTAQLGGFCADGVHRLHVHVVGHPP